MVLRVKQQRHIGDIGGAATVLKRLCVDEDTAQWPRIAFEAHVLYAELFQHHPSQMRMHIDQEDEIGAGTATKLKAIHHFRQALALHASAVNGTISIDRATMLHIHNTIGVLCMDIGAWMDSIAHFEAAIAQADGTSATTQMLVAPLTNLAISRFTVGDVDHAMEPLKRVLDLAPNDDRVLYNTGVILHRMRREDEAEDYWHRAISFNPDHTDTHWSLANVRGYNGDDTIARFHANRALALVRAAANKFPNDREVQSRYLTGQLLAIAAQLPLVCASIEELNEARDKYEQSLAALLLKVTPCLDDPATSVGFGTMGYYAIYHGRNDLGIRTNLAKLYSLASPWLNYTATHVFTGRPLQYLHRSLVSVDIPSMQMVDRRLRIGFHSAFLRHHSVGLLMEGVITNLPRDKFYIVVTQFQGNEQDALTERVLRAVDASVFLSADIRQAQQQVADLKLDVLVFTEIGMDILTYFLAHARLALRTAVFWGHAITTGLPSIDYFVSSAMFQDAEATRTKYSECVYKMRTLSTYFLRQVAPALLSTVTREELGLPPVDVLPIMFLVPQTLYKLHPDMDSLFDRILQAVPDGFLVFLDARRAPLKDKLTARWRRRVSPGVYRRMYFVPFLPTDKFLSLCAQAVVVLDPFPVGGGRSSFEIFAMGTPIVCHYARTSILQLTFGMYTTMGLENIGVVAHSDDEYVAQAVMLGQNASARNHVRRQIQAHSHKLFAQPGVVKEWELFFTRILAWPPPQTTDNQRVCPVDMDQPVYATTLALESGPFRSLELRAFDDPFEVARSPLLDVLQEAFVAKQLSNMQHRLLMPRVGMWTVEDNGRSLLVEVRFADDIDQVVAWQLIHHHNVTDDNAIRAVSDHVKMQTPHLSTPWVAARSPGVNSTRLAQWHNVDHSADDCITLIVTTCKRLALFIRTITSLNRALPRGIHGTFCKVLVIDDNSDVTDRQTMKEQYPSFQFVWKAVDDRGHAKSLNLALSRVTSRYVLYLEDDWEFQVPPSRGDCVDFVAQALTVLQHHADAPLLIAQVLLNNQDSGYSRKAEHPTTGAHVPYHLHEFAVQGNAHHFSYWPGFSLNPGLWDVDMLRHFLGDNIQFDESIDIFERLMSLQVWQQGLHVVYLDSIHAIHIGAPPGSNASAYVLNGLPRRFDVAGTAE
ncbi:TPA: hypothetical protein N0F65_010558 [Lagenidium giganteum]|uniref:protein O-GlcNAc transferase n=1 Tax=Lagenidium giganteum TaxID=4803 RepID=A0AAV2YPT2_9STRA|nr:TPA: hypothetical protein N0F65_010558 [Lagenidium giganteum]